MPDITLIQADGTEREIDAPVGISVMQAATGAGVAGILADCGGSALCATCHVMVDDAWIDKLPPPQPNELEMLECTACPRTSGSRLSCQIQVTPELHGFIARLPPYQQ